MACVFCEPDSAYVVVNVGGVWILREPSNNRGLLIPAPSHVKKLEDLPSGDLDRMFNLAKTAMQWLQHPTYQLKINQGSWQHVPHVHLHIATKTNALKNRPQESDCLAL